MQIEKFIEIIEKLGINFYTGIPDSQLKALCDFLMEKYGISDKHIVAANEGAAVGLAAGRFLASGNPALVYMQNSGIGNAINPICSLLNDRVYAIPALFVIGWRGEPGVHDEPQHIFQGEITLKLLECIDIKYCILAQESSENELLSAIQIADNEFKKGKSFAIVIKKGALKYDNEIFYKNKNFLSREDVLNIILENSHSNDVFVSTTGKLSRELFEAREGRDEQHNRDFLTVGSMGHSSMIALSIAIEKPDRRVYCLDGDGALLMHLGSAAVLGANSPKNFVHIIINNGAHETVGGIPTVSEKINYPHIAKACGYKKVYEAQTKDEIFSALEESREQVGPIFIEIKTNLFSRANLGRPTTTPIENRDSFMKFINQS